MRVLMYGSEHAAPATRVCDWAVDAGHEVVWAGYLGEISGSSRARHVQIQSWDNPVPELAAIAADFRPHVTHSHNFSFLTEFHHEAGLGPLILSAFGGLNGLIGSVPPKPRIDDLMATGPTVIVESRPLFDAATKRYDGIDCELICLGVNPVHYKPGTLAKRAAWRQALQIPVDAIVFFSARGIGDGYRQQEILRAFASALPDLPATAGLAMIRLTRSWDRSDRVRELQQLAEELGISERLYWIPEVRYEMMPGMYGMVDFVVNYPVADAFPSTLLEAAACGVPVVTANLRAYAGSYIEQFCELVDPDDWQALARGLVRSAREPAELQARRVSDGRRHVIDNFSETVGRERTLAVYERVARAPH